MAPAVTRARSMGATAAQRSPSLERLAARTSSRHWGGLSGAATEITSVRAPRFGIMYEKGMGVRLDIDKAREIYDKGCKLGLKDACRKKQKLP